MSSLQSGLAEMAQLVTQSVTMVTGLFWADSAPVWPCDLGH